MTANQYTAAIRDAADELGMGKLKLTAQHSGPSSDSLHKVPDIAAIQARGTRSLKKGTPTAVPQYDPSRFFEVAML